MTIRRGGSRRGGCNISGRRSGIPPALRRNDRIRPHSGRGAGRRARGVRHVRRAVRQESARSLFLHVPGRVRHLVFLAEHADARSAVDPDRAVHGAARAARHGHHRRRRRASDRRAGGYQHRARTAVGAAAGGATGDGLRRHDRRRTLDHALGRASPISRRQRNDFEPAAGLHRARDPQPSGRGRDARPGQPQQAVDPRDRRRQHDRHRSPAPTCIGDWCSASSPPSPPTS